MIVDTVTTEQSVVPQPAPKKVRRKLRIPFGVRCVIYSYLDLMTLLNKISKLSKVERYQIPCSEVLD